MMCNLYVINVIVKKIIRSVKIISESQSRYSIVEKLTETKLDIMTAKAELEDQILGQKQKITI